MNAPTNAQNAPESADSAVSDVPVMQDDTTPTEAITGRRRICKEIAGMASTLVCRADGSEMPQLVSIQRRLATLVRDTQPEVTE